MKAVFLLLPLLLPLGACHPEKTWCAYIDGVEAARSIANDARVYSDPDYARDCVAFKRSDWTMMGLYCVERSSHTLLTVGECAEASRE